MTQRTLVLIKPDAVRRGLVGTILARYEAKGLSLVTLELRQVDATQADPLDLTGAARDQVDDVADKVKRIAKKYPDAAAYTPGSVL